VKQEVHAIEIEPYDYYGCEIHIAVPFRETNAGYGMSKIFSYVYT
jgi:hypothetical protein